MALEWTSDLRSSQRRNGTKVVSLEEHVRGNSCENDQGELRQDSSINNVAKDMTSEDLCIP